MVRLYVSPEKLQGARAALDEAAHRHLVKVLRLGLGARLQLFDGRGGAVDAIIVSLGKASVEVELGQWHVIPAPACTITLLQSCPAVSAWISSCRRRPS
jgi:RsmE family RNA methyltransferase